MDLTGLVTLLAFFKEVACVVDTETVDSTSCQSPLGLAHDAISPLAGVAFTASEGVASDVRLNGPAAWTLPTIRGDSYLQVTLPRPLLITGMETQGAPVEDARIVSLRLQFSKDCITFVNHTSPYWTNTSHEVALTQLFHNVTVARCVRVIPAGYAGVQAALRLELLGCEIASCQTNIHDASQTPLSNADGRTGIATRLQSESIVTSLTVSLSTPEQHTGANLRIEYSRTCVVFVPLQDDAIGRIIHKRQKFILTSSKPSSCSDIKPWRKKRRRPLIIFIPDIDNPPNDCPAYNHVARVTTADVERQTIEISLRDPIRAQCLRVSISEHSVVHRVAASGCGATESNGPLSGCGQTRTRSGRRRKRVVGGDPIVPGDAPWLVSLHFLKWHEFTNKSGFPHLCAASLITDQWLLSAAHCFDRHVFEGLEDPANWRVALGEHNQNDVDGTEQFLDIEHVIKHPNFTFLNGPIVNDIALVKLRRPVVLSDYVNPICLDLQGQFPAGSVCVVVGWGQQTAETTGTKLPFKAMIPILESAECREKFESLPDGHEAKSAVRIDDSVFCAAPRLGGKDACLGDSGGPFYCEKDGLWYQEGVVSIGYGCGDVEFPGIYTRIPYFSEWIQQTMNSN